MPAPAGRCDPADDPLGAGLRAPLRGYAPRMSDYTESGAIPVEDAVADDPPTVDEVLERQRQRERNDADDEGGDEGATENASDAAIENRPVTNEGD